MLNSYIDVLFCIIFIQIFVAHGYMNARTK
jgi:hypothetical protein